METDAEKHDRQTRLNRLSEITLGCAFKIHNSLGHGFIEKPYENALCHEFRKAQIAAQQQYAMKVFYDEVLVGLFAADILVENELLLELKSVSALNEAHISQCINYLKATGLHLCLLLNFGKPRLEYKRIVWDF